jgi:uncharacterized membrane protein
MDERKVAPAASSEGNAGAVAEQLHQLDARIRALEDWTHHFSWVPLRSPTPASPPASSPALAGAAAGAVTGAASPRATEPVPAPRAAAKVIPSAAEPALATATPQARTVAGLPISPPFAPAPAARRESAPPPQPGWTWGDLDQFFSGRGLAWLGGLAILLGAIFFLGLAFTRGWIGPEARVAIGLVAGAVMIGGGSWCFGRREALFGHVLVAVGLGTLSVAAVAATRLYALVGPEVGLAGAFLVAVVAAVVAIRANSQVVAAYGLITTFAAPPLMGAGATTTTIAFLGAALVGTTTVALWRTWAWLPGLSFVLTAPQLALWVYDSPTPALPVGLTVLGGFWLLNAVAAGGEEFRSRRQRLRASSATVLLANAAFALAAGFALLDGNDARGGRGLFLLILACAHALIGGYFLYDEGDRHPFGLLATGTGLACFTMAIPIQFGGPVVPIAWAAEAVALTWVAAERRHGYSALAALALGGLAVAHLVAFEYPPVEVLREPAPDAPYFAAPGGTLGFILLALAVAGYLARDGTIRASLATTCVLLVIYTAPFELSGLALVAVWSLVLVVAIAIRRGLARLAPAAARSPEVLLSDNMLYVPALLAGGLAAAHLATFELPLLGVVPWPDRPFADQGTIGVAALIAAILAAGFLDGRAWSRRIGLVAAAAVAHYLMPFELRPPATIVAWALLALGLMTVARFDRSGYPLYGGAALALVALALRTILVAIAPPRELFAATEHPAFWSGATVALGALAALFAAAYALDRAAPAARWLPLGVAASLAYLLPFEVRPAAAVVGWAALAVALGALGRRESATEPAAMVGGAALLALGLATTLVAVAPPSRLFVWADTAIVHPPFWSGATAALGALVVALAAGAVAYRARRGTRWLAELAGVLFVYLLSVGVVDIFAGRLDEGTLASLQKQAQVALSILWAALGGAAFVGGAVRRLTALRLSGLALLAVATVKVFLFDMASLDATYRVPSFIALGLFLLASSYAYQRLRPAQPPKAEAGGG